MREYSFEHPRAVSPGRLVFRARNVGRLAHQFVLVALPEDLPVNMAEQVLDPAPRAFPTVVSTGAQPGRTTVLAVDLRPGRYGLVCFIEDADGRQHAKKGMASEFRVEEAGSARRPGARR